MSTLKQQVQRLTDIEDIKQLKLNYAYCCDQNYDVEGIAACFTQDAVWDGGELGKCVGKKEIYDFFKGVPELALFAVHYTTNPIIEVTGDSATGIWNLWQPLVMKEANQSMWLMAHYHEEYVRVDGKWLIKSLRLVTKSMAPHDTSFI
jgi:hypothetical protein